MGTLEALLSASIRAKRAEGLRLASCTDQLLQAGELCSPEGLEKLVCESLVLFGLIRVPKDSSD